MGSKSSPSLSFGPAFLSSIHLKHHRWSINGPLRGSLQRNPHCHRVFYSSNKKRASILSNIKMSTRSSMSFFQIPRRIRSATRTWRVSHWNRHNPNQPEQIAAGEWSERSERTWKISAPLFRTPQVWQRGGMLDDWEVCFFAIACIGVWQGDMMIMMI